MQWSAWKSLKSDGSIPDDLLPASAWQLRWNMLWTLYDPSTTTYAGRWTWQIIVSETPLFSSTVRVSAIAVFAGQLGLIAWIPEVVGVVTTLPAPPLIIGVGPPPGNGWVIDGNGNQVNYAENGYLVWDPSASVGAAAYPEADVVMDYESALYAIPLPRGAKLAIPFHNVAAGWLVKFANVQIRTASAGGVSGLRDEANFARFVTPTGTLLEQSFTGNEAQSYETRRIQPTLTSPVAFKDSQNRLYCAGFRGMNYIILRSLDDGLRWTILWGVQPGESVTYPMTIWGDGYSDIDMSCLRDGTILSCATKGGSLWFKTSRDGFADTMLVGQVTGRFILPRGPFTGPVILSDGQGKSFLSGDEGRTWQYIEAVSY